MSGSTSLTNIQEYTTNVLEAADYADCLDPIRNGQAVAVTTDNVILAGLADQSDGEFEVVNNPFTAEPYGIGLALDDVDFRDVDQRRPRAVVRGRQLGRRLGVHRGCRARPAGSAGRRPVLIRDN